MIHRTARPAPRRGIILLVVLALLTLFAIAGIAFVFYAQSRADSARVYREALLVTLADGPDTPPDVLFDDWIRQFLFDVQDVGGTNFWNSALRGHSMARTMYGGLGPSERPSQYPYSGTGRLHTTTAGIGASGDDYNFINYTNFSGDTRNPEMYSSGNANFSVPYTYPDLNNMYLAAVQANGTVLMPSFHRPWLFNPSNNLNDISNPNWTSASGKYMILRPRPNENPQFPYPTDATGDVKNLINSPGGNDSIWHFIGSPVKSLADGTMYAPCYAALVVDLDNRINLNVAGNILGSGNSQVSNEGIGPWEMNLSYVFSVSGAEVQNLFRGSGATNGRYGPNGVPDNSVANNAAVNLGTPHFYSFYDYDGGNAGSQSTALTATPTTGAFPSAPAGYGNGSATELSNHPQLFNPFMPGGDDSVFGIGNMKALLYDGPTGTAWAQSTLGKLCPTNFANARVRHLVTTTSWDLDQPGLIPWVYDPSSSYNYAMVSGAMYPSSASTMAFPASGAVNNAGNEFGLNGQASEVIAALGRIDLNRSLTPYPSPTNGVLTPGQALTDRQQLANDIFIRLVKVTGAIDPTNCTVAPNQAQYDAVRYLAQLAVNMVDYIDTDDYMTTFNWTASANGTFTGAGPFTSDPGKGWVVGTELPRLVLNEAYAEVANDPTDPFTASKATKNFNVNFFLELLNPFNTDPTLPDLGGSAPASSARLQVKQGGSNVAAYQIVIATTAGTGSGITGIRGDTTPGSPDAGSTMCTFTSWTADSTFTPAGGVDITVVQPYNGAANGAVSNNQGYYVVQSKFDVSQATSGPAVTPFSPTLKVQNNPGTTPPSGTAPGNNDLTYTVVNTTDPTKISNHAILLQRLACPYMAPNPTPGPNYNPYVTVDYLDGVPVNDGVNYTNTGAHTATAVASRKSIGRQQPYASLFVSQAGANANQPTPAATSQLQYQTATPNQQPLSTFFKANQPAAGSLNWLVHLDRQLTSPMELLQVSGFRPHELTQQFINPTNTVDASTSPNYQHRAPWANSASNLYRVFEFLETKNRVAGTQLGGRIPGKININTIWDQETFQALCDAQSSNSNSFVAGDISSIYSAMYAQRTKAGVGGAPGVNDQPFMGMAAGTTTGSTQYQAGDGRSGAAGSIGMQNTLMAQAAGGKYLFESTSLPATNHPYLRAQLLNKIFNNVTTRSNTFAVWLTVGFFQVTNNGAVPPQLGQEINLSSGNNIRHHMFAIVDRSTLGITNTSAPLGTTSSAVTKYGTGTLTLSTGGITPGTVLTIDSSPNAETIVVQQVSGNTITATFRKTHTAGVSVYPVVPGNPGPQPTFSAKDGSAQVPYYTIID